MKFPVTARLAKMCVLACALALVPTLALAFPEPDGEFFVDLTGSVRGRDKLEIARTLRSASEGAGVHAMLLVINRMADHSDMPQEIIPFANKVAEEWKVGEHRTHKGVITVFALQDRKFAVATSKQLDSGTTLDAQIKSAMGGRVTDNLRSGNVGGAMRVAASNIAEALPSASSGSSGSSGSSSAGHAEPRRHTTTTTTTRRRYQPTFHYSGGAGFFGSILGLMLMVFFFAMILRAFAPSSGGYGGGYGHGYGDGGGFWSGMFTGGMLGWMFGGHHGWGGYHYHGYGGHGGGWSDETTTTTTTDSWTSSSDSSPSYDSSSSSSSSFDSFGGGDFGGGGSSGEW